MGQLLQLNLLKTAALASRIASGTLATIKRFHSSENFSSSFNKVCIFPVCYRAVLRTTKLFKFTSRVANIEHTIAAPINIHFIIGLEVKALMIKPLTLPGSLCCRLPVIVADPYKQWQAAPSHHQLEISIQIGLIKSVTCLPLYTTQSMNIPLYPCESY